MFRRRRDEQEGLTWYVAEQSEVEISDDVEILERVGTHACKGCGVPVVAIHTYCSGCLKEVEVQAKANQSARREQDRQKWLSDQFNRGY